MSRYRNTMSELLSKVRGIKEQDDKDHEISMARGELEAIADKATQLSAALQGKSDDGNPLEAWVQSKITKAKDYINSVSDYMMYKPEEVQEELQENTYGWTLVSKAKDLAKKFKDNMTKAVDEIEKLEKGLSKNPVVYKELLKYNEEVELDEGRMKDIYQMQQDGKSAADIAKHLKLPVSTVKSILGEEALEIKEFTSQMIDRLKKSFSTAPKRISPEQANKLSKHLDRIELNDLRKLVKANIPFVSTVARNKIYKKTGKFESLEEQDNVEVVKTKVEADKKEDDKKEVASKEKENAGLKDQIALLKQKLENEKNKAIKPEPNPETGEVPLTIGIANKLLKDKAEKDAKKKEMKEERRLYIESIAAVKNKADKTGMPYSILKQVYDRGMAAWKGGHRPGATQVQWALARVNSFVTKSSGTWGGADKDLAAKVKGSK